jgi:hypothetical protein
MWDRMLQHCHSSTPPAHMHGMLEPCVQHLPLHHTITTPPQHLHIRSHHKHTSYILQSGYTTLQSHHNQKQITSITRVVQIRINRTRINQTRTGTVLSHNTYQKHIPETRAGNQTNKLNTTPPFWPQI